MQIRGPRPAPVNAHLRVHRGHTQNPSRITTVERLTQAGDGGLAFALIGGLRKADDLAATEATRAQARLDDPTVAAHPKRQGLLPGDRDGVGPRNRRGPVEVSQGLAGPRVRAEQRPGAEPHKRQPDDADRHRPADQGLPALDVGPAPGLDHDPAQVHTHDDEQRAEDEHHDPADRSTAANECEINACER